MSKMNLNKKNMESETFEYLEKQKFKFNFFLTELSALQEHNQDIY